MKATLITKALILATTILPAQQRRAPRVQNYQQSQQDDLTRYVDPFIGTQGGGNTFPGASLPFGMVKTGPDCGDLNTNSGYHPTEPIRGFSQVHVNGSNEGADYQIIWLKGMYRLILNGPDPGPWSMPPMTGRLH